MRNDIGEGYWLCALVNDARADGDARMLFD
jgi:hypothetical protein